MKKLLLVLCAAAICGCTSVHYEAACFYGDVIHSAMDDSIIGKRMTEYYSKWTEDFDSLKFSRLKEKDLHKYYWCY